MKMNEQKRTNTKNDTLEKEIISLLEGLFSNVTVETEIEKEAEKQAKVFAKTLPYTFPLFGLEKTNMFQSSTKEEKATYQTKKATPDSPELYHLPELFSVLKEGEKVKGTIHFKNDVIENVAGELLLNGKPIVLTATLMEEVFQKIPSDEDFMRIDSLDLLKQLIKGKREIYKKRNGENADFAIIYSPSSIINHDTFDTRMTFEEFCSTDFYVKKQDIELSE